MSKKGKKALEGVMEYKEYDNWDQFTDEEKAYAKQFYNEYYANGMYNEENPILTAKDHIKEAHRNYNRLYQDAFNVTKNLNKQVELTDDQREVLELASDEVDYETAFKQGGYELAIQFVMDQAIRDIENKIMNKKVVLSRFYVKMIRVKKLLNEEKRKQK